MSYSRSNGEKKPNPVMPLTEAEPALSQVHVFSEMGDKNPSSSSGAASRLMQELVNELNGASVSLAATLLFWVN